MTAPSDLRRSVQMFHRFAPGERRTFVFALVLLVVEAGTAVFEAWPIAYLIDYLEGKRDPISFASSRTSTIAVLTGAIVLLAAVNSLTDSLAEIELARAGRAVGYNLRVALFGHLQKLSLAFHARRRTGDVLTRITSDVQALEEFVVQSLSDFVGSFLLLTGTLIFLLTKSWQVTLLAILLVPLLAGTSTFFARRIKSAAKQLRAREGDLASSAQEMLTSISVVQIYGRAGYEQARFAERSHATMDAFMTTARIEAVFSFTVSVLQALVIAIVVWVGVALVDRSSITVGTLVFFIILIENMFKPTRRIIKEWNTVGKVYASVERVADLLEREPAVQDAPDAIPAPPLHGHIEFRDVAFAYQPNLDEDTPAATPRLALDGMAFTITAGEVVALVGHSGAGKSTIAQLVPRLYDPHSGAVLVDGHDVRSLTIESLRAQIGMVLQETVLFSGTVADNIGYGREGAGRDEIIAAAEQAHAHEFIMALPQGYDTMLGERAATLSGGQRQRLAIARAFIRDSPILVLDEPTTGLDAESSALVLEALRSLVRGKTALIISHDLNLVRIASRILVVSAGRLLEDGTSKDLLARHGLYAELHARQFGEVVEPSEPAASSPVAELEPVGEDGARRGGERRAFETVLMQAVPLPASPEAFQQLTGRIPVAPDGVPAPRRPETAAGTNADDLNPLTASALLRVYPDLASALDPQVMAEHLQRMLRDGCSVTWCAPGKALVDPEGGVTLRYRVGLRDAGSGDAGEHVIAARMFASVEAADAWMTDRLAPLAAVAGGRPDLAVFAHPVARVSALRLVLHAFPIDPDLPGLLEATDEKRLPKLLSGVLVSPIGDLDLAACRAHVVQYARRGRCVLRYDALWRLRSSRRTVKQLLYGKVYSDDEGATLGEVTTAVREHLRTAPEPTPRFLVPRLEAYVPHLRLALLEALPGSPQVPTLVRDRVAGSTPDPSQRLTLELALHTCARIAATLHSSGLTVGSAMTLEDEIETVHGELTALSAFAPELTERLAREVQAVSGAARDHAVPVGFGHGDFTPAQVLFDGPLSGLVDLDTAGVMESARDVGQFLAYLGLLSHKARAQSNSAERSLDPELMFLDRYLDVTEHPAGEQLRARADAYRTLAVVRIAVRSWLQLKPARLGLALQLLDEPADVRRSSRAQVGV